MLADPMGQRLEHLESIVKGLIAQKESPLGTASDQAMSGTISQYPRVIGLAQGSRTVIDSAQSVYKAADDWHDVLHEVNEIKKLWNEVQDEGEDYRYELSNVVDGTSLLFSQVQRVDEAEVIASLPPKPEIDKLLRWFFDRENFPLNIPPIIHEPTFMQECAQHWREPSRTSIMWVGLLFSILGITMLAFQFSESSEYEGISESRFDLYRLRTAQCLLMGDIAKCLPYTIETLRFNATAELNRKDDNSRGLWIMTGVIVRAAVNMGYHRDPSHTPSLSTLKAEYRRRVWLSVTNMDEVTSFLSGFPRMAPTVHADTREPHNLHDWELDEGTSALHRSRPLSETTSATYLIAKSRLFRGLGNVVDLNNSSQPVRYATVLDVDKYLQDAYINLPVQIRLDASKGDRNSFKNQSDYTSLQLMCMYHHGLISLHRNHIPRDGDDSPGNISRARCINAALALLEYQRLLQPRWYTFYQTRQMLARAAMVLLLELESRRKGLSFDTEVPSDDLLRVLDRSVAFWSEAKDTCAEACKVQEVLQKLIGELNKSPMPSTDILQPLDTNISNIPSQDINWSWWNQYFETAWP
ncbi:hypothetical protein BJX64DRAFT_294958 [Aspergillus heterothallicus]